mmetsp:Transcript_135919/g.434869  ORF Transcript_135919/g.434869 Transcript_135919/m.434869 type:complete len:285 (+) Transcript_135919:727-1581(+)
MPQLRRRPAALGRRRRQAACSRTPPEALGEPAAEAAAVSAPPTEASLREHGSPHRLRHELGQRPRARLRRCPRRRPSWPNNRTSRKRNSRGRAVRCYPCRWFSPPSMAKPPSPGESGCEIPWTSRQRAPAGCRRTPSRPATSRRRPPWPGGRPRRREEASARGSRCRRPRGPWRFRRPPFGSPQSAPSVSPPPGAVGVGVATVAAVPRSRAFQLDQASLRTFFASPRCCTGAQLRRCGRPMLHGRFQRQEIVSRSSSDLSPLARCARSPPATCRGAPAPRPGKP